MAASTRRSHDDYTVGWVCALPIEMAAAKLMLDEVHDDLPLSSTDHNTYILGSMKGHNIVIACLPSGEDGLVSANTVAMQLLSSFRAIRFGLMVGIGGAVPNCVADIRLGDVVVSKPTSVYGGVIQYDHGKALSGRFQRTGMLNRPPQILLTALSKLQAKHLTEGSKITDYLTDIEQKIPGKAATFTRPTQKDYLFLSDYHHIEVRSTNCTACDPTRIVSRPPRSNNEPVVHYGLIASGNQVVKDSKFRDRLGSELEVYCVEMEAAGLMNKFPCLVIRGICDYADSHKNDEWQSYASIVAAAYAKELLSCTSILSMDKADIAGDSLSNGEFHVQFDLTGIPAIENFLGRHEELGQLWQHLRPEDKGSRKVAVLHGMGGLGKTQLAIQFAREHKDHFTAIFWLAGKSRETLLQSMSSASFRLPDDAITHASPNEGDVERNAKRMLRWLSSPGNTRWLLIFDNIDQYSPGTNDGYDIKEFFPTADHGSILITSRLQSISELGHPFPLQVLGFEDSILLLWQSRHLPVPDSATRRNKDVVDLVDRLGGLPLAITIAGSFMRETGTNVSEYLQYYKKSWHDLQTDAKPGRHYQQGNILQTWSVSYDEIRRRDPAIAELLLLLAHFDNRDIWYELLESGKYSANRPSWFTDVLANRLVFKKKIRILIEFSLINFNEQKGSYMMHPVVQDWCLDMASTESKTAHRRWDELALVSVGHLIPTKEESPSWRLQRRLLVHANHVRQVWISDQLTADAAIFVAICNIIMLYFNHGRIEEAEMMGRQGLASFEKALGPDHPFILGFFNEMGTTYVAQQKWKESEIMFQRALLGFEKNFGPDHASTLNVVGGLGLLYLRQVKWKEAETMLQRALAGFEKTLGPDSPSALKTVSDLGVLYRIQGKWKEAETKLQRALAGFEKTLGPEHRQTLHAVHNIAILYFFQNRWHEADMMYRQARAGYEKAIGPDHFLTLTVVENFGDLYKCQGKWKEARMMYQQALAGFKKILGSDHKSTLGTIERMGRLYEELGNLDRAMVMYRQAWVAYEKTLGPDHDATQRVLLKIGCLDDRAQASRQRDCT